MDPHRNYEWLMHHPASRRLIERIHGIPAEARRFTPFPEEWIIDHELMIRLVDAGFLGMDGFKYCFTEYAEQCRRVCRRREISSGDENDKNLKLI